MLSLNDAVVAEEEQGNGEVIRGLLKDFFLEDWELSAFALGEVLMGGLEVVVEA